MKTYLDVKYEYATNNACAITGHRILEKSFDKNILKNDLESIIKDGYNIFNVGMAMGFDMVCFEVLYELKKVYQDVKIIACVPCSGQNEFYPKTLKEKYVDFLEKADKVYVLQDKYDEFCMRNRNIFMVQNCAVVYSYLYQRGGGTYQTVRLASDYDKKIKSYGFSSRNL